MEFMVKSTKTANQFSNDLLTKVSPSFIGNASA